MFAVREMKFNNVLDQGQGLQRSVEIRVLLAVELDNDGFVLVDDEVVVAVEALKV